MLCMEVEEEDWPLGYDAVDGGSTASIAAIVDGRYADRPTATACPPDLLVALPKRPCPSLGTNCMASMSSPIRTQEDGACHRATLSNCTATETSDAATATGHLYTLRWAIRPVCWLVLKRQHVDTRRWKS
eukprot:scaffold105562_cov30-Tisochrysis_lutea.AAC.3